MAISLHIPATEEYAEALKWGLRCVREIYYYEQGAGLFRQPAEEVAKVYDRWEEFIPLWTSPLFGNMKKEIESKPFSNSDDYDLLIKKISSVFKKVYTEAIETQKFLRQCTPEGRQRNISLMKAEIGEELAGNIDKWILLATVKNNLDEANAYLLEMKSLFYPNQPPSKQVENKLTTLQFQDFFRQEYIKTVYDEYKECGKTVQRTLFDRLVQDIQTICIGRDDIELAAVANLIYIHCLRPRTKPKSFREWLKIFYDYADRPDGYLYHQNKLSMYSEFIKAFSYLTPQS